MSLEKTDALVIRLADWSESSRVITLFTRDFGKISALAKGAKRLRSSFEAALDLLSESRVVFLRKSSASLDILTESQLISRFRPSPHSLNSLYCGYYIAELLTGLTEEYDPHPPLYDVAIKTLREFEADGDARVPLLRFELCLLKEIGHLPEFSACVRCGAPLESTQTYSYWVAQGGLLCRTCQHPNFQQTSIPGEAFTALHQFLENGPDGSPEFTPRQAAQLRTITTSAITHVLERRPSTLRYLNFD